MFIFKNDSVDIYTHYTMYVLEFHTHKHKKLTHCSLVHNHKFIWWWCVSDVCMCASTLERKWNNISIFEKHMCTSQTQQTCLHVIVVLETKNYNYFDEFDKSLAGTLCFFFLVLFFFIHRWIKKLTKMFRYKSKRQKYAFCVANLIVG